MWEIFQTLLKNILLLDDVEAAFQIIMHLWENPLWELLA